VLNHATFRLARDYRDHGMAAYVELQDREFAAADEGYEAVRHQQFVGAGYFDAITKAVSGGTSSALAMEGSTEQAQFAARRQAAAV
jgi:isocitrate lyase